MFSDIHKRTITYLLYDGNKNYDRFDHVKEVFKNNDILKADPTYYSMKVTERLNHELKCIREIIRLYKSKILTQDDIPFINYVVPYSHPIDSHFSVFRNAVQIYGTPKQNMQLIPKIESLDMMGSCLIGEFNPKNNRRFFNFSEIKTIAELDLNTKKITLRSKDGISKLCSYFSYFSTHVIVFAKLLIESKEFGIHAFLVPFRDPETLEINKNIQADWLGRSMGDISYRQHTILFNGLEIPFDNLLTQDDVIGINTSKVLYDRSKNVEKFHFLMMLEACRESRFVLRNLFKAIFLSTKYNNMRTQFKTIDNSKEERKIFDYQQNKTRITDAYTEALFLLIGLNNITKNKNMLMSNIQKNQERIEHLYTFSEAFKAYAAQRAFHQIQILRETCGGWGFMQFSGLPSQVESSVYLLTQIPNHEDKLIEFALFFLGKTASPESSEKFIKYYYQHHSNPSNYESLNKEVLEKPFDLDNLFFLATILNLRTTWHRKNLSEKFSTYTLPATRSKIKTNSDIYNNFLKFGETLIQSYCFISFVTLIIFKPYRDVNSILNIVLHTAGLKIIASDPEFLTHFKDKKPVDEIFELCNTKREENIDELAKTLPLAVNAFEFDDNCLNCIVGGNSEKFYNDVFDWIRNKNLRNKPELHEEIIAPLRSYLNRKGVSPSL